MGIELLTAAEAESLKAYINSAEHIIICCHKSPDGDAIGSSLAWADYLRTLGKNPEIIVPDAYPDFLQWMPGSERIIRYDKHAADKADPMDWDIKGLGEYLERVCLKPGQVQQAFDDLTETTRDAMIEALTKLAHDFYAEREEYVKEAGADMREIERVVLLGAVDNRWMDHIDAMDRLREGIGLRAYGHRDPVVEYKTEGYQMFEEMIHLIQEDTLRRLYFFELQRAPERKQVAQPVTTNVDAAASAAKRPVRAAKKVGRNDPCPCGSGKKYKYCCGKDEV